MGYGSYPQDLQKAGASFTLKNHLKRERIIACCCYLSNYKVRTTGINQIKTYYDNPDIPSLSNSEFRTRNRNYTRLVA